MLKKAILLIFLNLVSICVAQEAEYKNIEVPQCYKNQFVQ